MKQNEMLETYAFQEFDTCIEKYAKKVKNVLYTIVGYAYNEGYKEGVKQIKSMEIEKPVMPWNVLGKLLDGTYKGKCGNCGFVHYFIEGHDAQYKFCPQCGEQKMEL